MKVIEYASIGELITWDENKTTFFSKDEDRKLSKTYLQEETIRLVMRGCVKALDYRLD